MMPVYDACGPFRKYTHGCFDCRDDGFHRVGVGAQGALDELACLLLKLRALVIR